MRWRRIVEEIKHRSILAMRQGGSEGIARQHEKGRLTIRERIDLLLDAGSFQEQGLLAGSPINNEAGELIDYVPANYVLGFGRIQNRPVVVGGEDFTLKGGSPNASGLRKSVYAEHLAVQYRVPLVRLLEGGGGSVRRGDRKGGAVGEPVYSPPRFRIIADAMSQIPVVSAALGPVAGFPAGRLVASHFAVMTRDSAQIMIGGPALVARALGRKLSKEELGGAWIHARSGVVDRVAANEQDALLQVREFLSYMPQNAWQLAPRLETQDPPDRIAEELLDIVPEDPNQSFDMRRIIKLIVDDAGFFEMGADFGGGTIGGLARLSGQPVGILANDNRIYAGAMTAQAAQKTRRLIELFDSFHIPIVNLIDEPGFMIGPAAERDGTIRYGMAAVAAAAQANVPWAAVQIHKCFGVAGAAHFGSDPYLLIWPSAESGALPLEGGVAVAFQRELANHPNPAARRRELEDELRSRRSPFPRVEGFSVHAVIDPRETRPALCDWIGRIQPLLPHLLGPRQFGMRP